MNLCLRLLLISVALSITAANALTVSELRCEYLRAPLGIDVTNPRLSWVLNSPQRCQIQTAYQVLVASSPEILAQDHGDLWDSGKVSSDNNNQIEYAGRLLKSRMLCYWKVRSWDKDNQQSDWSQQAAWTMGLLQSSDWQAHWIGLDPAPLPSQSPVVAGTGETPLPVPRYFRKTFTLDKSILRATLYATALGLYELRLNGSRVGDHLLAPEWTDYHKRVQYQTYDVTAQLRPGQNALGAMLGNGWYCGDWQFWKRTLRPINDAQPCLLVQLEIEFRDGSRTVVSTDASWRGTLDGPLRFSGIYEGETYDARMEMPGWDAAGFDDKAWTAAANVQPEAGTLVWQPSEPIRVEQEIKPVAVTEPRPGVYVFDMGQNMAGWCRLKVHEPADTLLTLKLNEVLNPDGTVYMDNLHAGHMSGGDRQIIRYTCRGGEESYEPHFTYQGFRYVEISGLTHRPSPNLLTGCVFHTGFVRTGSFACSNPLINRLVSNIQWSQRANMMGIPTDCCQRDERCGYTGDMNFFIKTAVYNFDIAAFVTKWLRDVSDSQNPKGWFTDFAPWYGGPGGGPNTGWADAGIICPYVIWQTYGDTRVIRDHYASMQRYLAYLAANSENLLHIAGVQNGDWLNLGGGASKPVIGTAYDAYDFQLMAEMAHALGKGNDAATYQASADAIARAFAAAYIDGAGRIKESSQTGFALAFTMGLVRPDIKQKMSDQFRNEIHRFHDHLATGFIGTPRLLPALHLAGSDDLAYRLLLNDSYPSWLFEVKNGASTMWERWNGWTPAKGFASSGMNSFNHYAFGSVGEYLYAMVAGIQPASPGYREINIDPVIRQGIDWVNCSYDSIEGRIASNWKVNAGVLTMDVTIPPNTSAAIHVPASDPSSIFESGGPSLSAAGVSFLGIQQGAAVYHVGSGTYHFQVAFNPPASRK